jgi:Domain of unknown function (DUF4148)
MKSLVYAVALASSLSMPLVSFAQVQSNQPLTRAEVEGDLARLEQAGYKVTGQDPHYPADIQAAEARVAQSGVGGVEAGSAQAGVPADSHPTNVDGVHPLYFGR